MIPAQLEWKSMNEEKSTYDVRRTTHSLSSGISHPSHANVSGRRQSRATGARRLDTRLSLISSLGRVRSALFGRTTNFLMYCGISRCLVRPTSAALKSLLERFNTQLEVRNFRLLLWLLHLELASDPCKVDRGKPIVTWVLPHGGTCRSRADGTTYTQ